jgi:GntR family transcriptional regulator/MocR family aminotransferase
MTVTQGNEALLSADLGTADGRAAVEAFVRDLVPTLRGQPKLLKARDGHFMDKPDSVVSLINLATVRRLEEQWGFEIDPLRFRANIYVDGAEPWEEFDWIGSDIRLGEAVCRVDRRNGRCSATNVNPVTGRRDLDIPGSLRAAFGHKDLGVYLTVSEGGRIAVGDTLDVARGDTPARVERERPVPVDRARSFICRGCYFIYEEEKGLPAQSIPPGTPFASIPATWRCPDCGTDKATFRPYVS